MLTTLNSIKQRESNTCRNRIIIMIIQCIFINVCDLQVYVTRSDSFNYRKWAIHVVTERNNIFVNIFQDSNYCFLTDDMTIVGSGQYTNIIPFPGTQSMH